MKQIIVVTAVLLLLLTFPLQYALEQKNYHHITQFQNIVYNAKEKARAKGFFTPELIEEVKENIIEEFDGINESEIIIEVTENIKYRQNEFDERGLIHYKIGVPIKAVIASPKFWGIREEDNSYYYIIESFGASERVMP